MAYLALYRKYRPFSFDDVYGQEEVVTVIKNAIANNKISHAYLFCGPRGTGKTTIAKIIARLINCENLIDGNPCGKCYNCINFNNSNDIVEIDAASNNGVDEIRELRDKVNLVPSNAKYKVYIIDEVHMLTTQAFNALLKTLEEPPSHVIFILATTEPHKIPLTIASRCQKFRFSKIDDDKIVDRIKEIAKCENISVQDDAFYEIARVADGGMRDAINILDQLTAYSNGNITLEDVNKVVGSVSYDDLSSLIKNIAFNDKNGIIRFVDYLDKSGKEIGKFIPELVIFLKDVILYKNTGDLSNIMTKNASIKVVSDLFDDDKLYKFVEVLNDILSVIKVSSHGSIVFMTYMLRFSDEFFSNEKMVGEGDKIISREIIGDESVKKSSKINNNDSSDDEIISREIILGNNFIDDEAVDIRINNAFASASKEIKNTLIDNWKKLDDYIYDESYSLISGLLKDASVMVASSSNVIIASESQSVVSRINENIDNIENMLDKVFNLKVKAIAISNNRWLEEKEKYIKNVKNGVKYVIKEEKRIEKQVEDKTPVDKLIELVGDNMIEYK